MRLLLLPGDPEGEPIAIDDEFWAWVKNFSVVQVDGRNLRLGAQEIPTAHAAALVDSYGSRDASAKKSRGAPGTSASPSP